MVVQVRRQYISWVGSSKHYGYIKYAQIKIQTRSAPNMVIKVPIPSQFQKSMDFTSGFFFLTADPNP
jgi:hypothetical protein